MKGLPRSQARATPTAGDVHKRNILVKDLQLTVADGAPGWGTAVLQGLPEGNLLILGTVSYLQLTNVGANVTATFDGNYSLGTSATADNALAGTEVNIVPSTAMAAASANTGPVLRGVSTAASAVLDNTDKTLNINLNVLINDASISGAGTFKVNGVVSIAFIVLGDD